MPSHTTPSRQKNMSLCLCVWSKIKRKKSKVKKIRKGREKCTWKTDGKKRPRIWRNNRKVGKRHKHTNISQPPSKGTWTHCWSSGVGLESVAIMASSCTTRRAADVGSTLQQICFLSKIICVSRTRKKVGFGGIAEVSCEFLKLLPVFSPWAASVFRVLTTRIWSIITSTPSDRMRKKSPGDASR